MARKRTRGERAGLTRERVLDAAVALVDREGLAALSMRGLGAELGVEAMTLYHHVPNKDALLDGLVEWVLERTAPLVSDGRPWQEALGAYAHSLRETLLCHPGVLPLVTTRAVVTPTTLRAVEGGLRTLREAGFAVGRALDVLNSLTVFVVGHTAAEAGTGPVSRRSGPGSAQFLAELDAEEYPLITEAVRTGRGTDDEERFDFAVRALVTGFADSLREQR